MAISWMSSDLTPVQKLLTLRNAFSSCWAWESRAYVGSVSLPKNSGAYVGTSSRVSMWATRKANCSSVMALIRSPM